MAQVYEQQAFNIEFALQHFCCCVEINKHAELITDE